MSTLRSLPVAWCAPASILPWLGGILFPPVRALFRRCRQRVTGPPVNEARGVSRADMPKGRMAESPKIPLYSRGDKCYIIRNSRSRQEMMRQGMTAEPAKGPIAKRCR